MARPSSAGVPLTLPWGTSSRPFEKLLGRGRGRPRVGHQRRSEQRYEAKHEGCPSGVKKHPVPLQVYLRLLLLSAREPRLVLTIFLPVLAVSDFVWTVPHTRHLGASKTEEASFASIANGSPLSENCASCSPPCKMAR